MTEPEPILTPGVEPSSMESHSPPSSPPRNPTWGTKDMKDAKLSNQEWNDPEVNRLPEKIQELDKEGAAEIANGEPKRKRLVVVGLGMVGIAFM